MPSRQVEEAPLRGLDSSEKLGKRKAVELLPHAEYRTRLRKRFAWMNPVRLVLWMAVSIFIVELGIMHTLHFYSPLSFVAEEYLDATLLVLLLSPLFYFFHYRPIRQHEDRQIGMLNQLLASEERLQLALVATNDGVWDWDIPSDTISLSPQFKKMLGGNGDALDLDYQTLLGMIHVDDRDEVKARVAEHLAGRSPDVRAEYRLQHEDGSYVWVLGRGRVVEKDALGEPLRMVGTHSDISFRKQAEATLQANKARIRELSHELINSTEEEKRRLSRDLHDEFGQVMTAVQMGLEMLQEHDYRDEEDYQFQCRRLTELVQHMERDVRQICDRLRPVMLDTLGLQATLERLLRDVGVQKPDLTLEMAVEGDLLPASDNVALVLFRICQEALNNSLKYAAAQRIKVDLRADKATIRLSIEDDGCGFDQSTSKNRDRRWGLGLLGMQERALGIDGQCTIRSAPGEGTRIEVQVPLFFQEGE